MIPIFSTQTLTGLFTIDTDESTFAISPFPPGSVYRLRNDKFPSFARMFPEPYDAIRAVAENRIGLPEWDASSERVSDYAGDWVREDDKAFRMKMLGRFLDARPHAGMSELVQYFEYRHNYFLNRLQIEELIEELLVNGAMTKLPNMDCAQSELKSLTKLAEC
jgi:hypothetical protein